MSDDDAHRDREQGQPESETTPASRSSVTAFAGTRLYLGTDDGVRVLDAAEMSVTATALSGNPVRDLAVGGTGPDTVWAGCALGGRGLHRVEDAGAAVESAGFEDRWVWGVDRLPDERLYVGTEPPGLFRREDGGFTRLDGIDEVAGREAWSFGYAPFEAGHVHGLTAHPTRPERLYGAVEIGGVLLSTDGGATWQSRLRGEDVHRLTVTPGDPDHVFAAAETGVYESRDAGDSWEVVDPTEGMYVKHLAYGPAGVLFAPAAGDMGDTDVRVFAYDDGWERRMTVPNASVLAFAVVDGALLLQQAGDRGRLLVSTDGGRTWDPVGPELPRVRCIRPVE